MTAGALALGAGRLADLGFETMAMNAIVPFHPTRETLGFFASEELWEMELDEQTRMELESAAFRRLVEHLRERSDVQNIAMMELAGFCRNCLSRWYQEAAEAKGLPLDKEGAREIVYGMPYDDWKARHQTEATPAQRAAIEKQHK